MPESNVLPFTTGFCIGSWTVLLFYMLGNTSGPVEGGVFVWPIITTIIWLISFSHWIILINVGGERGRRR